MLFRIMLWSFFRSDQIGTEAPVFRSGAFSSREPVPISLENALEIIVRPQAEIVGVRDISANIGFRCLGGKPAHVDYLGAGKPR
jgi:hypothetical protein